MAADLAAPPVLSTPDDHILEIPTASETLYSTLSDDVLAATYEIARTAAEIREGGWMRIALQFPDHMLVDAPRVAEVLGQELDKLDGGVEGHSGGDTAAGGEEKKNKKERRICILADTSYSACCVDEIAAEHTDADMVVHYGRTCLSPTSRLPVIYVYTHHELDYAAVIAEFEKAFAGTAIGDAKVVVMADLPYQDHVQEVVRGLREDKGYAGVVGTEVVRDPAGLIPNRRVCGGEADATEDGLKEYALFHISDPAPSLLLALHNRFSSLHVLSTKQAAPSSSSSSNPSQSLSLTNPTLHTAGLLRRRFAKVLTLASAGVIGILVNTLSVSDCLLSMDVLRARIAAAGKKSYTVVVGKLNPAKLANFAEIEGWVVVGCWESGLVEDEDGGYWRPVVTPFEMEVALMREEDRVWGGEWWGGIERMKGEGEGEGEDKGTDVEDGVENDAAAGEGDSDMDQDESLPPEFDLRTGKLVSHSRPMRLAVRSKPSSTTTEALNASTEPTSTPTSSSDLIKRTTAGQIASINGVVSPGAEFLRSKRTWQGLGSDFATAAAEDGEEVETSTVVEEGRRGVARGYVVGEGERH